MDSLVNLQRHSRKGRELEFQHKAVSALVRTKLVKQKEKTVKNSSSPQWLATRGSTLSSKDKFGLPKNHLMLPTSHRGSNVQLLALGRVPYAKPGSEH